MAEWLAIPFRSSDKAIDSLLTREMHQKELMQSNIFFSITFSFFMKVRHKSGEDNKTFLQTSTSFCFREKEELSLPNEFVCHSQFGPRPLGWHSQKIPLTQSFHSLSLSSFPLFFWAIWHPVENFLQKKWDPSEQFASGGNCRWQSERNRTREIATTHKLFLHRSELFFSLRAICFFFFTASKDCWGLSNGFFLYLSAIERRRFIEPKKRPDTHTYTRGLHSKTKWKEEEEQFPPLKLDGPCTYARAFLFKGVIVKWWQEKVSPEGWMFKISLGIKVYFLFVKKSFNVRLIVRNGKRGRKKKGVKWLLE